VKYRPVGASALLRDNMLIYGVSGLIAPFIGISDGPALVALGLV
jgi:K+-transporting ATPase ATPase B chain